MFDLMRKGMLMGLGVLTLSEEKARSVVEELVEQGKMTREEGEGLVDELVAKGDSARKEWEAKVNDLVQEGFRKAQLTPTADLEALQAKVEELEARLAKLEGGD